MLTSLQDIMVSRLPGVGVGPDLFPIRRPGRRPAFIIASVVAELLNISGLIYALIH